jgi:preprotein translocase SecE subunit
MAKTRAQRKAEQRRRRESGQAPDAQAAEARAQHLTQVPESADVIEAEAAEAGVEIPAPNREVEAPAPAPSRADVGRPEQADAPAEPTSRREAKRAERERKSRAKENATRRAPKAPAAERKRGGVIGFLQSCWAELKKVQWPNRETLVQASGVTVLFIAIAAAYLGALDSIFNYLVQHLL